MRTRTLFVPEVHCEVKEPTTGKEQAKHELTNDELSDALKEKIEFTEDEWSAFDINNLRMNHFIKSDDSHYFKPTEPEQKLGETGLQLRWEDVWPALEMIDSVEELEDAVRNPQQFMVRLFARALAPMLLRAAVRKARPILEPRLQRLGVRWEEDAVPMLEAIDSVEELQEAINDPRGFLNEARKRRIAGGDAFYHREGASAA